LFYNCSVILRRPFWAIEKIREEIKRIDMNMLIKYAESFITNNLNVACGLDGVTNNVMVSGIDQLEL